MAKGVCRAMAEGRPLWLSRLYGVKGLTLTLWPAVFVVDDEIKISRLKVISFVFTTS
jgi:hypothetical protein